MKFKAKISFTIDKDHPDRRYVPDWKEDKVITYEDEYRFSNEDATEDEYISYIKRDLRLVAGGGYNADHIHNVEFKISRI